MNLRQTGTIRWWPLVVIGGFWLVFWWPVVWGREQLFVRDLTLFALPAKHYILERFAALELPMWTAKVSAGMPFFADLSNQVLYPGNLLVALAPDLETGLSWFVVVHGVGASVGCYALSRSLGLSRAVSLWTSLTYGMSGYVLSISDNVNYLPAVAWVPAGLAAFVRGLSPSPDGHIKWRCMIAAASCLAMLVLAGDTFNAPVFGFAAGLIALFRVSRDARRAPGFEPQSAAVQPFSMVAVQLIGVGTLAAGLCAIQILPAFDLLELSVRGAGVPLERRGVWSFPPQRVLELVQPFLFGTRLPAADFLAPQLYPTKFVPWADSVYIGLIPVLMAITTLGWSRRAGAPWWILGATAIALGIGQHASYFGPLTDIVPFLDSHRYPEKWLYWVTLSLCMLAGLGAQALLNKLRTIARTRPGAFARILTSLAVLTALAMLLHWPVQAWLGDAFNIPSALWSSRFGTAVTHGAGLLLHTGGLGLVLLAVCWSPAPWWRAATGMLLMLAVADLWWVHHGHLPTAPADLAVDEVPWAVTAIERRGSHPLGQVRVWFDSKAAGRTVLATRSPVLTRIVRSFEARDELATRAYFLIYASLFQKARIAPNHGLRHGVRYLNAEWSPLQALHHRKAAGALLGHQAARYLASVGVGYVITAERRRMLELDVSGLREIAVEPTLNLRVLEVANPAPRVRLVPTIVVGHDSIVGTSSLPGPMLDTEQRTLIHRAPGSPSITAWPQTRADPGAAAKITSAAPEHYELAIVSPYDNAMVVLDESWFPGWSATINSTSASVHIANRRFLAVQVPKGEHRVTFSYQTPGFSTGVLISALTVGLCIALLVWERRRQPGARFPRSGATRELES